MQQTAYGVNSMSSLFLNALVERSISELNNTLLFLETDVIPIHSNGLGKPSIPLVSV